MIADGLTASAGPLTVPVVKSVRPLQNHRFAVLDGLRGGAAIMVVITHTTNFAPMAYLAVGFFFLLSGFVLAYAAGDRLGASGQKRRFAVGRLIRLYPLYFAGTAIALLPATAMAIVHYDFWTPKVLIEALAAAPFFIPLPYESTFPLDLPAWTLTFELFANVVFLFTGWRWLPCGLIVLISLPLMLWDPGNSYWGALAGEVPVALFCYFLGVVMCRAWCGGWLPKFGLHPLLLLAILCGLYAYEPADEFLYVAVLTVLVQPVLLWVAACSVATGISARIMAWLGMASYGIYMLHMPISMWVLTVDGLLAKSRPALAGRIDGFAVLIVLPLSLIAAHVLTGRFEAPLRKWLWSRYDAKQPALARALP